MKKLFFIFLLLSTAFSLYVYAYNKEFMDSYNNPSIMGVQKVHYQLLPKEGQAHKVPWSGDYWANFRGRSAWRWQTMAVDSGRFSYSPYSSSRAINLSTEEIAKLSPAEKFDLYLGRTSFNLTRSELGYMGRSTPVWYGMCHGRAVAAILEEEPGEMAVMRNSLNQTIIFYRDDIKALLTRAYTNVGGVNFMGRRCQKRPFSRRSRRARCRDVNPGSFHLALTQLIGQEGRTFIIDTVKSKQVWNHPIVRYKFNYSNFRGASRRYRRKYRAREAVNLVTVNMELVLSDGIIPNLEGANYEEDTLNLKYTLELNGAGIIIGGEWHSYQFPDFAWYASSKPVSTSLIPYPALKEILNKSLEDDG